MTTSMLDATTTIARVLTALDHEIEHELADLRHRAGPTEQVACARGCAACCSFAVGTTTAESERIAAAVDVMPPRRRTETLERLSAWAREWRLFEQREGDALALVAAVGESALVARDVRWNAKRKACPFLDLATHDCRVYAVRPVACRTHHACHVPASAPPRPDGRTTHPPGDGCFTTEDDAARGAPPGVWQLDATLMERYGARLLGALDDAGISWAPACLPVGVLDAGRRRFGWRPPTTPAARAPVPTLRSTWPRGGRRDP